jgi:site-specific DNA recombinase
MKAGAPGPKPQRCAIYTRVSTEHGLEQEFNSLHAQREAAQAYVESQAHEGWKLIRDHYDDGGFSGGSMERPALQKLLADIKERRIDIVVVYKVDRLTRSLTDFARLVELFEEHGVSFVSVTQSFNTTSSMGRLTLNVLLSFAQFEREVTGERIRDKIAASKRKGLWVGGVVPLGYQVKDKKLILDQDEAQTLRLIFELYRELGSLPKLQRELRERGIVTRSRTLSSGKTIGRVSLTNGPLVHLLRNRMYLGEINHRDKSYPGEHQPIIDQALFDAVQATLDENRRGRRLTSQRSEALLLGKLYDDRGNRMTPSYAIKKGVRYRYYVSCVLAQGRKEEAGSVSRVAAEAIERLVLDAIQGALPAERLDVQSSARDAPVSSATETRVEQVAATVERITLGARSVEIRLHPGLDQSLAPQTIVVPWTAPSFRRKRELLQPSG